jgi:hypothetical protein
MHCWPSQWRSMIWILKAASFNGTKCASAGVGVGICPDTVRVRQTTEKTQSNYWSRGQAARCLQRPGAHFSRPMGGQTPTTLRLHWNRNAATHSWRSSLLILISKSDRAMLALHCKHGLLAVKCQHPFVATNKPTAPLLFCRPNACFSPDATRDSRCQV